MSIQIGWRSFYWQTDRIPFWITVPASHWSGHIALSIRQASCLLNLYQVPKKSIGSMQDWISGSTSHGNCRSSSASNCTLTIFKGMCLTGMSAQLSSFCESLVCFACFNSTASPSRGTDEGQMMFALSLHRSARTSVFCTSLECSASRFFGRCWPLWRDSHRLPIKFQTCSGS